MKIVNKTLKIRMPGSTSLNTSGNSSGESLQKELTAGESISALRVVKGAADGKVLINTGGHNLALGLSLNSAVLDGDITVLTEGYLQEATWAWDTTKPIFFDSLGQLTQTAPISGFAQVVASPLSTTEIIFNIQQSIKIN